MVVRRFATAILLIAISIQPGFTRNAIASVVLITGADSDIGLALAIEYVGRGWQVIATCVDPDAAQQLRSLGGRHPSLTIEALDLLDHQQIDRLAERYRQTPIDVLVNNAELAPLKSSPGLGQLEFANFDEYMAMNVIAPLKVTEAFVEHVAASEQKTIITITSADSSITDVKEAQDYFYRASKAAVNIVMVTMAPDLSQRGIVVGLIARPMVEGDSGNSMARKMLETISSYTPETSATFRRFDGRELAW